MKKTEALGPVGSCLEQMKIYMWTSCVHCTFFFVCCSIKAMEMTANPVFNMKDAVSSHFCNPAKWFNLSLKNTSSKRATLLDMILNIIALLRVHCIRSPECKDWYFTVSTSTIEEARCF